MISYLQMSGTRPRIDSLCRHCFSRTKPPSDVWMVQSVFSPINRELRRSLPHLGREHDAIQHI